MTPDADAAPDAPPTRTLREVFDKLNKELDGGLEAWLGDGHADKLIGLVRRVVCGLAAVAGDAPTREGVAVFGRIIDALEDWSLRDQREHIKLLAAEAKVMTNKDLSEDLTKQILAWSERRAQARGTATAEWGEKAVGMALQAAGMPGVAGTVGDAGARWVPHVTIPAMTSVDIEEVTFLAGVDGKEIEHVYDDDADLDALFKSKAPIGRVFGSWVTNPEAPPLHAAQLPSSEIIRNPEALGFFILMDIRDGRGILGYRMVFTRPAAITAILGGQHALSAVLETVISNLTYEMYPDSFELMSNAAAAEPPEPSSNADGTRNEGEVAL